MSLLMHRFAGKPAPADESLNMSEPWEGPAEAQEPLHCSHRRRRHHRRHGLRGHEPRRLPGQKHDRRAQRQPAGAQSLKRQSSLIHRPTQLMFCGTPRPEAGSRCLVPSMTQRPPMRSTIMQAYGSVVDLRLIHLCAATSSATGCVTALHITALLVQHSCTSQGAAGF